MKPSISSPTVKSKTFCTAGVILLITLAVVGLFVGKYPLALDQLLNGNEMHWKVFITLRCSRTVVGVIGGFALGIAGFIIVGNPCVGLSPSLSADCGDEI